ncbi:DNA (cytosine-5-)-methyltransferase [Companilactobacillus huachuanensis]|uniref:Cytosine-specific methyltransferase n=1 Tax=Companilactobacillus huachuanensis TaxID=2559914 RepID=A0ABW1RLA4_9LACO|nr:DNA (cytosine-5-)-methyltransferase [Companilactobacillus huachuanensis]
MTNKFKVFSMFDGVGGFIVGLNHANESAGKDFYKTTYTNQFEPGRKSQDAFEVGEYKYSTANHCNTDIMKVPDSYFDDMKDNGVNMIVGGFPCQDYSVARSKKFEKGIEGKKGVLFWEIIRAVKHIQPKYLILENVDRLLKSPSSQRGRDFAIMLAAFDQLDYSVEWRVINAADYGRAQRRRRVYFYVYRNDSGWGKHISDTYSKPEDLNDILELDGHTYDKYIFTDGLFARKFPIKGEPYKGRTHSEKLSIDYTRNDDSDYILDVSDNFTGKIWNTGVMRYGQYFTIDTEPIKTDSETLGEVVQKAKDYYIHNYDGGEAAYEEYIDNYVLKDEARIKKFEYLRGPKKLERTSADGHQYTYSEGGMSPFDSLDLPGRTMLTSEGSVNRSTHLLKQNDKFRIITPIEAELLQDFPPDWTKYKKNADGDIVEVSDRMRMFFMGNALVTTVIKRIGEELALIEKNL